MKPSHRANTVCALIICLNISACTTLQEKFSKSHVSNTQADAEELPPAALHQKHIALLNTIQSFQLKGRIGVQTEGKGYSASTQWQHSKSENQISILSPIGTEIANLSSREDAVTLRTQDGKTFQAKDAESLTQDTLGWRLPLQGLEDWALGRPSNSLAELIEWDKTGKITKMSQNGWLIEYPEYIQSGTLNLPKKIFLKHPKLSLKIAVENWTSIVTDQE